MQTSVKKVPPLGRNAKRPQRPYPKADITVEDQQREQKKLLNAGKAFSGYSRLNLDIIAISYEHKCFAEAKNKEDYLAKIRKKLIEWKYVPEGGEEVNTVGPLQPPPQPPGLSQKQSQSPKAARSHHQRHRSGPIQQSVYETTRSNTGGSPGAQARPIPGPTNTPASPLKGSFQRTGNPPSTHGQNTPAFQPPYPQLRPSQYPASSEQEGQPQFPTRSQPSARHSGSPYPNPQPQHNDSPHTISNSPKSQPMSHTATAMSDSSSASSQQDTFMNLFDPEFLKNFNLNDPEVRTVWINSVWEYFCSGGRWDGQTANGSNAGSQSNSPVPLYNSLYATNEDAGMQGIQHATETNGDVDMMGSFGSFNHRAVNGYGRRQSEDLARVTSYQRHHHDHINNNTPWMTSELLHMSMDIGMGNMSNMDGIMAGDGINSGISNRHMEKWMVQ